MKTLHQIYDDQDAADAAVKDLEAAGLTDREVTVLSGFGTRNGAETGFVVGVLVGAGIGVLAATGVIVIPGLEPLVAAGWVIPVLSGLVLGALAGSIIGGLGDDGIRLSDAHTYAKTLRRNGALVIARVPNERAETVRNVLCRDRSDYTAPARHPEAAGWRQLERRAR